MAEVSRRSLLRKAAALGGLCLGVACGVLPRLAHAAWPKAAFEGKEVKEAMTALYQTEAATPSPDIRIRAPEIAENGTVVPITIITTLAKVTSISLIAEGNPRPLASVFKYTGRTAGPVTTRIKLAKTQLVTAVVESDGKLYKASQEVKVTIGGCGG